MLVVSTNELQEFVNIQKIRCLYLQNNYRTISFAERREYLKMNYMIQKIEALIWYNTNIGNIRGYIDRLPICNDRTDLLKCFNTYNSQLRKFNRPSIYTGLVPGLNERYSHNID